MSELVVFIGIILVIFFGIILGQKSRKNSINFFTYLIIGLIFTTPLMVGGYTFYDEIFLTIYLLFNLNVKIKNKFNFYEIFFIVFIIFMSIQVLRGIFFYMDFNFFDYIKKIRWLYFFALILITFLISRSKYKDLDFQNQINSIYLISKYGILFLFLYSIFGLISFLKFGGTQFIQYAELQESWAIFGATAYVSVIYLMIIPAGFVLIKQSKKYFLTGVLLISFSVVVSIFFGSRISLIYIIFLVLFFFVEHLRKKNYFYTFVISSFILILILLVVHYVYKLNIYFTFIEDLYLTIENFFSTEKSLKDIDRRVWNISAIEAIRENIPNFLFGWGYRTSGYIIAPYVYDLFIEFGISRDYNLDVSATGFTALLVDTGFIGILMFIVLIFSSTSQIFFKSNKLDIFILISPIYFTLIFFVINITDVILYYLILMPNGLYLYFLKKK